MPACRALSTLSAVSLPIVRAMGFEPITYNFVHKYGVDYDEGRRTCPEGTSGVYAQNTGTL